MTKLLIGACIAALVSGAASATHFTFSDQLDNHPYGPGLVTGSFDGDLGLDGLITNLSNPNVNFDGVDFTGPLYIARFGCGSNGFCDDGGAQASLDGSQNNFLFINSDLANGDFSYTQYFYSLTTSGNGDYVFTNQPYQAAAGVTHFNAQIASVPEPASWALMLGGFGAIGGALRSRRKASVSFG